MSLLRPIVEYVSSVWNPTQVGLRGKVEYVQRWFTKRMRNLQHFSNDERCKRLHLATLEHRRNQADLIATFKVLHGELDIDEGSIGVAWSQAPTKGCGANLLMCRAADNVIGKSYCFRIAKLWDSLPAPAKRAQSLSVFKKLIAWTALAHFYPSSSVLVQHINVFIFNTICFYLYWWWSYR